MSTPFAECAENVQTLFDALTDLERAAKPLQLPPLAGREWYQLLVEKLQPQLSSDAFLVAAVVGGTNIGKSVIFNHLAGDRFSATSPLASGTKHPTALVPDGFPKRFDLSRVFPGFELINWEDPDAALVEADADRLFWKEHPSLPPNLLVLDTPDIDSDARVNWDRADSIRRVADVLVAVLTQQKYNDAAVKQFFRQAAREEKAVLVVFNQCLLPDDEAYWPVWLNTFCDETGLSPEFVYVAPNDRQAAEHNSLPFYLRRRRDNEEVAPDEQAATRSLATDLSSLHFERIKLQTLRGSLAEVTDAGRGAPSWLAEIRTRSSEFQSAAEVLSTHKLAQIDDWPPIPNNLLVAEIRQWWGRQREGWSRNVHEFYNTLGAGLMWPIRFARRQMVGEETPPFDEYRRHEWNAILRAVEKVYERMQWFGELGNELLQPRIDALLSGQSRAELLKRFEAAHAEIDLEHELQQLVARELATFRDESPDFYQFLKTLDAGAAAARPATSIVLFMTGFGPAGDAAAALVADSALQTVVHVAGDVAGGTVAAAVGETTISSTTASGVGFIEARFRRLHSAFTAQRVKWLAGMLEEHFLGSLPAELQTSANLATSTEYRAVEQAIEHVAHRLEETLARSS